MCQPRLFCSQLPPTPSVHVFHALALISTLIAPASESGSGRELSQGCQMVTSRRWLNRDWSTLLCVTVRSPGRAPDNSWPQGCDLSVNASEQLPGTISHCLHTIDLDQFPKWGYWLSIKHWFMLDEEEKYLCRDYSFISLQPGKQHTTVLQLFISSSRFNYG